MTVYLEKIEAAVGKPEPDFEQLKKVLTKDGRPRYVPVYELYVVTEVIEKILGKKLKDRSSTVEFYYKAGYDYVPAWPRFDMVLGDLTDTTKGYPICDRETFDKYEWPDPSDIDYSEFDIVSEILPKDMKIIAQHFGIFECVQMLTGYENLCIMLYDDPQLVEDIFEHVGRIFDRMYEKMSAIRKVGAVVISDDLGFRTQTLIGAGDIRKYIIPQHKKQADMIHKCGKPCILHSCGQISEVMEDLIGYVGIDAKHSYEDNIMPVADAARTYGDRIGILGGLDMDYLCRHSADEVRGYAGRIMTEVGGRYRYALGSGNSIPLYMPTENYIAIIEEGFSRRM